MTPTAPLKTAGYKSNIAPCKIDKRQQIMQLAQSYVGALKGSAGTGSACDDFARAVYGHLGLTIGGGGNEVTTLYNSMNKSSQDIQKGSIVFYHLPTDDNTFWRRAGVNTGGGIVDQNCGLEHDRVVYTQPTNPFETPVQTQEPMIGTHSASHPDLLSPEPGRYAEPSFFSTNELQGLDDE